MLKLLKRWVSNNLTIDKVDLWPDQRSLLEAQKDVERAMFRWKEEQALWWLRQQLASTQTQSYTEGIADLELERQRIQEWRTSRRKKGIGR